MAGPGVAVNGKTQAKLRSRPRSVILSWWKSPPSLLSCRPVPGLNLFGGFVSLKSDVVGATQLGANIALRGERVHTSWPQTCELSVTSRSRWGIDAMTCVAYIRPMPNISPVKYDSAFQLRTDPAFRAKVEEMAEATKRKASDLIRAAFEEKYSRWKRQKGRET